MLTADDRTVASALAGVAGVRAVSLGGSRVAGAEDVSSDTDLYAWYVSPLAAAPLRRAALAAVADGAVTSHRAFGDEDHFTLHGRRVEVVYLDLDVMDGMIQRARTEGLSGEVCATAFLHTVATSVPIHDADGQLVRLRALTDPYPEATRTRQLAELPALGEEFAAQLAKAQERGDWPMVLRRRAGLVDVVASLAFAVNRTYHPGEKRLATHLAACPVTPSDLVVRVDRSCLASPSDPALAADLTRLVEELIALGRQGPADTVEAASESQ